MTSHSITYVTLPDGTRISVGDSVKYVVWGKPLSCGGEDIIATVMGFQDYERATIRFGSSIVTVYVSCLVLVEETEEDDSLHPFPDAGDLARRRYYERKYGEEP